ncbi:MAG: helix-turn-helix domain-containing protein [Rickettsiales bacterium]|nr:helix-turn-helix domain-containing protein [Rickettsiales bacterium]
MKILIQSKDSFIINYIQNIYSEHIINNCDNNVKNYNIIIFDCINTDIIKEQVRDLYLPNYLVVNITNNSEIVENIVNINTPFKVITLKDKIDNFISYYNKNVINIFNGVLNINKNTFMKNGSDKIIQFTTKEIELIYYLYKNDNSTREDILENVWQMKLIDNKVIETTVYNIKQKMARVDVLNFIECNNGLYKLGK